MNRTEEEGQKEKSLLMLFMEISRCYAGRCFQQIAEMEIHPSQMPFIMILSRRDGCSQKEMAEYLDIKPPTVNVSIQRLEKSGIVCRRKDELDQRIMRVYLTEKGKETVNKIMRKAEEMEKIMFQDFSETELCLLRRFFEQMLNNLHNIPGAPVGKCKFMKKEGTEKC